MTPQRSITAGVQRLARTKSPRELIDVVRLIVRQGRAVELAYGGYCTALHRPSRVYPCDDELAVPRILARIDEFTAGAVLARRRLEEIYGGRFAVDALPPDFAAARRESVLAQDDGLILGEYGEGARIARVTPGSCALSDYYRRIPGVRHIHSIQDFGGAGKFLVSTGDGCKFLDLWVFDRGDLRFERRLRSRLAGYTAAIALNGRFYFGSDFSLRPNFIATLEGAKYFFPEKAYRLHVAAFEALFDRYIVAVNKELDISGGRRTLSIFDTRVRRFVFCDYMQSCPRPPGGPP